MLTGHQKWCSQGLSGLGKLRESPSLPILPATQKDPVGLMGPEAIQKVAKQGREGIQRQGRNNQEITVHPWGRVLVPPQGMHIAISLNPSAELKPPPNGRCSREKLIRRLPEAKFKECRPQHTPSLSASLPLNHCYKTPHQIPQSWTDSFERLKPTVSPFAG